MMDREKVPLPLLHCALRCMCALRESA
jgi:hypothetical protein